MDRSLRILQFAMFCPFAKYAVETPGKTQGNESGNETLWPLDQIVFRAAVSTQRFLNSGGFPFFAGGRVFRSWRKPECEGRRYLQSSEDEEQRQLNHYKSTDDPDTTDGSGKTTIKQEQTWHGEQAGNDRSHSRSPDAAQYSQ